VKSIALKGNSFVRENNRIVFTKSHLDFMKQRVYSVVSIFLAEHFLYDKLGIPYLSKDYTKSQHKRLIDSALITKVTAVDGIDKVVSYASVYQPKERKLYIEFIAQTINGEQFEMKDVWMLGGKAA